MFNFNFGGENPEGENKPAEGFQFNFDFGNVTTEQTVEKKKEDEPPEYLSELNEEQKKSLEELKQVQSELDDVKKQYEEELRKLNEKFAKIREPLYNKRHQIITKKDETDPNKFIGIPNFWQHVIENSEIYEDMFQKHDRDSLKYLDDIRVIEFNEGDKSGFHIDFHYRENPYFENSVLRKTYFRTKSDLVDITSQGTEIKWKEGKNLTVSVRMKKQRHKGGKLTRKVRVEEPCDSFYNFFKNLEPPQGDEAEGDDDLQAELEAEFQDLCEMDVDIGQIIAENIVPNAIKYYTGELKVSFFDEEDDDDDEELEAKFNKLNFRKSRIDDDDDEE